MADLGYAILRGEKLSSKTVIRSRVQHAIREMSVPNADPERAHLNQYIGPRTYAEFKAKLDSLLDGVRIFRSDSPPLIEFFIGASPEFFTQGGDDKTYFNNAMKWANKKFGPENIVAAAMHRDEASPHISLFICPRVKNPELVEYELEQAGKPLPPLEDGKKRRRKQPFTERPPELALSAISYMQGRKSLSAMQTEFWEMAGKPVGLKRGREGSKSVHLDMREWKDAMTAGVEGEQQTIELRKMTLQDRYDPTDFIAEVKAVVEAKLRQAAIVLNDAKQRNAKLDIETKRIKDWENSVMKQLMDFKAEVDVVAQKQTAAMADLVRDKLNSIPVLKSQVVELQAKVDSGDAERKALAAQRSLALRALAKTIKADYPGEKMLELEAAFDIAPGKDDIFARLVKSGKAENFEAAVVMVAAYIDQSETGIDGGGRNAVGVTSELNESRISL